MRRPGRTASRARAPRRDRRSCAQAERRRHRCRRPGPAPADARRRVPDPDRTRRGRGPAGGNRRRMRRLVTDTLVIAERNLIRLPRAPDLLLAFTVQPIMFVLLFRYVFGGAIQTPGFTYVDFLIPGIIVQNIAFGGFVTALGLNEDVHKGLIDRFRSLLITGVIIGFTFHTNFWHAIAGVGLLLLFGYAFSWVFAYLGLLVSSPEAANSVGFIAVFPVTFISSAFVPVASMPEPLKSFAMVNPFTYVVDARASLWLGARAGNHVWGAVVWSLVILAVFAPLAVARYRKAAGRS